LTKEVNYITSTRSIPISGTVVSKAIPSNSFRFVGFVYINCMVRTVKTKRGKEKKTCDLKWIMYKVDVEENNGVDFSLDSMYHVLYGDYLDGERPAIVMISTENETKTITMKCLTSKEEYKRLERIYGERAKPL